MLKLDISFSNCLDLGLESNRFLLLWIRIFCGSGSDPGSQNVADPTDPGPILSTYLFDVDFVKSLRKMLLIFLRRENITLIIHVRR